jgi:hypothetical protein
MRVGILVECGRDGLEDVVVRRICDLLRGELGEPASIDVVPMDNKAQLIRECGRVAAPLLASGCDRVVILWDQRPAWPRVGQPLCWHNDRVDVLASLRRSGVPRDAALLVCIEREFESWLLFDEPMLSCVLSTKTHPVRAKAPAHPDKILNPKGAMMSLFRRHLRGRYEDAQFARQFARCLSALNRLRRCRTFRRFERCVTGSA